MAFQAQTEEGNLLRKIDPSRFHPVYRIIRRPWKLILLFVERRTCLRPANRLIRRQFEGRIHNH